MIEIKNLHKEFKNKIIYENVNINIKNSNEIVTFWGESGVGKSTLLNMILGYDQKYKGEIKVFGKDIKKLSKKEYVDYLETQVSIVYQDFKLFEELTVNENLKFINKDSFLINKGLKVLGLEECGHEKVENLSGGEKQRVAIMRAILKKPQILILDEPTASLDVETFKNLMKILEKLKKNIQIIVVTHDKRFENYSSIMYEIKDNNIFLKKTSNTLQESKNKNFKESKNKCSKITSFKSSYYIMKSQKYNYINKIFLIIIFTLLFSIFFSGIYTKFMEQMEGFYADISDNIVILNFTNIKNMYEFEENDYSRPKDKLFWSVDDKENVMNIEGVDKVFLLNKNEEILTDKDNNTLNLSFNPTNYPKSIKEQPSSIQNSSFIIQFKSLNIPKELVSYYNPYNEELVSGAYPKDETNGIIIPDFMAEELLDIYKYDEDLQLIGQEIKLEVKNPDGNIAEQSYIISGIYHTNYKIKLEGNYFIYTSYFKKDNEAENYLTIYDNYEENLSRFDNSYFEEVLKDRQRFKEALGSGYLDMIILLKDNADQEYVYDSLEKLYPNNVQQSRYSYSNDISIQKYRNYIYFKILIILIIFIIMLCSLLFVLQRGYYMTKTKYYSILLSLGYSKIRLLKILLIESGIDIALLSIGLIIVSYLMKYLKINLIASYLEALSSPAFIIITLSVIVAVSVINILYILIRVKYKELTVFLQ